MLLQCESQGNVETNLFLGPKICGCKHYMITVWSPTSKLVHPSIPSGDLHVELSRHLHGHLEPFSPFAPVCMKGISSAHLMPLEMRKDSPVALRVTQVFKLELWCRTAWHVWEGREPCHGTRWGRGESCTSTHCKSAKQLKNKPWGFVIKSSWKRVFPTCLSSR